jgi:hypothetical protein
MYTAFTDWFYNHDGKCSLGGTNLKVFKELKEIICISKIRSVFPHYYQYGSLDARICLAEIKLSKEIKFLSFLLGLQVQSEG